MNFLIIHQNFPGQFGNLATALARVRENRVVFLTKRSDREIPGVERIVYPAPRPVNRRTHHYLYQYEDAVLHGQAAAVACLSLKQRGFVPDLVVAHPGWGESLFIKDVWPEVPILNYGEFYYRPYGADVNFGTENLLDLNSIFKLRARSAHLLLALEAASHTVCPTEWQKSLHPSAFRNDISVIHDGIDTDRFIPDPAAVFTLPNGRQLTKADEVVTYVARNLEPYRGFPGFMRSLPLICALRPQVQIVILGSDETGYGARAPDGKTWRQKMTEEISVDPARVHFLGAVPSADYLRLLQVSSAHVYLTVPFVLSWSALEAMSAGCLVIGSRTSPVIEVIAHGKNGLLVDFFSTKQLAESVAAALDRPDAFEDIRSEARRTIIDNYALNICLPRQLDLIDKLCRKR